MIQSKRVGRIPIILSLGTIGMVALGSFLGYLDTKHHDTLREILVDLFSLVGS